MPAITADTNLLTLFGAAAEKSGESPFLWAKRDGAWRPWSWRRVADEARRLARALRQFGLEPGDRVVLVSENRPEWCIADLAVLMAGGITVPAYTTNTPDDHAYILGHSGARMVICSGRSLAGKLLPAIGKSPSVRLLLFVEPFEGVGDLPVSTLGWADALALGDRSPALNSAEAASPDDAACFIYTSGTGGQPKGVMLSHRNVLANVKGAKAVLDLAGVGDDEIFLSFLPLSHSYEHTAGQFFPMAIEAQIYYAEGVESLSSNLVEVKPTIVTCVPRLYEVLRQKITASVAREGGIKARLFDLAVALGRRRIAEGRLPRHLDLVDRPLDLLVRKKVGERFGGRLKAMVSGGAPLNEDVALFFMALGVPVLQGYGQTEAAPVIAVNLPGRARPATVGPPLDGVEVRIADDGEILVRGDNVMLGYWQNPEATAEAVRDGWLHTGDVGAIDPDGYLRITDRKKDIIVGSGGDNIAPQRVEGILLLEGEIGQALVYGDRKPYLVALIVPHQDFVRRFAREHGKDAGEGKGSGDPAGLARDPVFRKAVGEAVRRANTSLSAIERVRRFEVMDEPFTVENGLMTPTLKLRRPLIYQRHHDLLEGLYAAGR
ncbi:MAG: long-chain fatty acid--CoA ligase [Geminicoccaceae bacterium]|nr:long-chain fatty acid--CoA ligase [Geminicoccaceae bacterium]